LRPIIVGLLALPWLALMIGILGRFGFTKLDEHTLLSTVLDNEVKKLGTNRLLAKLSDPAAFGVMVMASIIS